MRTEVLGRLSAFGVSSSSQESHKEAYEQSNPDPEGEVDGVADVDMDGVAVVVGDGNTDGTTEVVADGDVVSPGITQGGS